VGDLPLKPGEGFAAETWCMTGMDKVGDLLLKPGA
jgi:hypothetical protein